MRKVMASLSSILIYLTLFCLFLTTANGGAACRINDAEHPSLTNQDKTVAVCGSMYDVRTWNYSCNDEEYHVCTEKDFRHNYPHGCWAEGYETTYNVKQWVRCQPCTQGVYEGMVPNSDKVTCSNFYDTSSDTWNGYQPPATFGHDNDGKLILKDRHSGHAFEDWLWSPSDIWTADVDWKPLPAAVVTAGVFCCADQDYYPTQACKVRESEHPAYTSAKKKAALCGGGYNYLSYDACGEHWHVCAESEWKSAYPDTGAFPGGLESTFNVSQKTRGVSCPIVAGHMWEAAAPQSSEYFCGNTCAEALLPVRSDGIMLLSDDGRLKFETWSDVHNHWLELRRFQFVKEEYDLRLGVMCCQNKKMKTSGRIACPNGYDDSASSSDYKALPWWGVLILGIGMICIMLIIALLFVYTRVKVGMMKAKKAGMMPIPTSDTELGLDNTDMNINGGDDEEQLGQFASNEPYYDDEDRIDEDD